MRFGLVFKPTWMKGELVIPIAIRRGRNKYQYIPIYKCKCDGRPRARITALKHKKAAESRLREERNSQEWVLEGPILYEATINSAGKASSRSTSPSASASGVPETVSNSVIWYSGYPSSSNCSTDLGGVCQDVKHRPEQSPQTTFRSVSLFKLQICFV